MRATFMSRARIALAAAISATILAIGICMASTPATAQALTVSNGAEVVTLVPDGPQEKLGNSYVWVKIREETYEDEPGYYDTDYYLDFFIPGRKIYSVRVFVDTYQEAVKTPCRCIKLNNGKLFIDIDVRFIDGLVGLVFFDPVTFESNGNDIDGLGPQRCGVPDKFEEDPDLDRNKIELTKVSGNTMTVRYTRYTPEDIFKYNTSRTVVYDYKFVYDSSKQRMKRDSTIATVKKNTTTWRTLAKKRTAYKSSTSSTKKFTISKGSKVQVKKVYTDNKKGTRYYVKTKSGKYGWISANYTGIGA